MYNVKIKDANQPLLISKVYKRDRKSNLRI